MERTKREILVLFWVSGGFMRAIRHNTIFNFIIVTTAIVLLTGCGGDNRSIDIRADGWPDGAVISMIDGDTVAGRTPVYGSRARLTPPPAEFRLRIAHPSMLTAVTGPIAPEDETGVIQIPAPVNRRRFGSWRIGMGLNHPDADSLATRLCEQSSLAFTTLDLDPTQYTVIQSAHDAAIECLIIADGRTTTALVEIAERHGFDGIVTGLDSILAVGETSSGYDALRESTRLRGMSLVVRAEIRRTDGEARLDTIATWFTGLQEGMRPDEIRLAFRGDADVPVVSAERIDEVTEGLAGRGIHLGIMSIDIAPAAVKYRVMQDGSLAPSEIERGEVAFLFAIVSGTPGVRLRDGSLRIGSRGDLYVVEDAESIARKAARLRSGPLTASAGVHITSDEYGILIGPGDLRTIADAVISPETVMIP